MMSRSELISYNDRLSFLELLCRCGERKARKKLGVGAAVAEEWGRWAEEDIFVPSVIHENRKEIKQISPVCSRSGAVKIGDVPLVSRDVNKAAFQKHVYSLNRTGVYRFVVMCRSVRNVIRLKGEDPLGLLEGLSLLQVHGNRDDNKPLYRVKGMLQTQPWIIVSCGRIADLAVEILKENGFKARKIFLLALSDWGHCNSHSLIEVFSPSHKKWVLVDVDMGRLFKRKGVLLNGLEVWRNIRRGENVTIQRWVNKMFDPVMNWPGRFNYSLYLAKYRWADEKALKKWYYRVFESVAIKARKKLVCLDPTGGKAKEYYGRSESVSISKPSIWAKKFYP